MADTVCKVNAGICGKTTRIIASLSEDMMSVNVTVESDCPLVQKMSPIQGLNPYELVGQKFTESDIYKKASDCIPHTACPVPCAIVKCAEAASGMALKRPVSIEWE